jgi:hypothetical protein
MRQSFLIRFVSSILKTKPLLYFVILLSGMLFTVLHSFMIPEKKHSAAQNIPFEKTGEEAPLSGDDRENTDRDNDFNKTITYAGLSNPPYFFVLKACVFFEKNQKYSYLIEQKDTPPPRQHFS